MSEAALNAGPPMPKLVLRLVNDNRAVTSIEYALIAGSISVTILLAASLTSIGTTVQGTFNTLANALQ